MHLICNKLSRLLRNGDWNGAEVMILFYQFLGFELASELRQIEIFQIYLCDVKEPEIFQLRSNKQNQEMPNITAMDYVIDDYHVVHLSKNPLKFGISTFTMPTICCVGCYNTLYVYLL